VKPEQVPAELVALAAAKWGDPNAMDIHMIRVELAAVLPVYAAMVLRDVTVKQWEDTLAAIVNGSVDERLADMEKQLRAKLVTEIEAAHGPLDVNDVEDGEFDEGVQAAIATVRTGLAATRDSKQTITTTPTPKEN
jgi:hypothetical protein